MSISFFWLDPDGGSTQLGNISTSKIKSYSGLGMAPLSHFLQTIPSQHRSLHRGLKFRPRIVQLSLWSHLASASAQDAFHTTLLAALNPDRGEGVLKMVLNDGTERRLSCRIQEGPDFASEDRPVWGAHQFYVVRFVAGDPFLYNPTQNNEETAEEDDEIGGSFGPTYHGLSLANDAAFFRCQGVDLSGYAGTEGSDTPYCLRLHDSAGKIAYGFIGAADAAEALGGELLSNIGFETAGGGDGDIWANWVESTLSGTLADEGALVHGGSHAMKATAGALALAYVSQNIVTVAGKLYKLTFWTRGDGTYDGQYWIYDGSNSADIIAKTATGVPGTAYTEKVVYFTAPAGCTAVAIILLCPSTTGGVAYFDDVSAKEVTDVGADGIHIVSAKDGSTRNWTDIEAGFDYNDSAYTFEVLDITPSLSCTNSGDIVSYPTITIPGPVTNLLVTLGSNVIDLDYSLAAANTITINCKEGTIKLQDDTDLIQYLTKASVFWALTRGANTVAFTSDSGFVKPVTVAYYDRFLGV